MAYDSSAKTATGTEASAGAAQKSAGGIAKPAVPVLQQKTTEEAQQPSIDDSASAAQKKENNTGLPDQLKTGVESLSGYDMGDVKVHFNSSRPAQFQALAYAQGTDIHVAPGQERHLPHEAWHVVQQKQGRVHATRQMKQGIAVNDDQGLEKEADVMGAKALSEPSAKSPGTLQKNTPIAFKVSQMALIGAGANKVRVSGESADEGPYDITDPVDRAIVRLTEPRSRVITYYNTVTERYTTQSRYNAVPVDAGQGSLSAELSACVDLVRSSPTVKPTPAWIRQRVEAKFVAERSQTLQEEADASVAAAWIVARAHFPKNPGELDAAWEQRFKNDRTPTALGKATKKHNDTINAYMRDKINGADATLKFKWNEDFSNSDGDLPGDAGAGGYGEYYAQPDPAHDVSSGFWGMNRVLRHRASGNIYTTATHYSTYKHIV